MSNNIKLNEFDLKFTIEDSYSLNANTNTNESYLKYLKSINKLPFNKGNIYYSDNLWDFSEYTTLNICNSSMRFNFNRVNITFQEDVKNYILVKLLENTVKIQSLHKSFNVLCVFFNFIEAHSFYNVKDITLHVIKEFLESEEKKSLYAIRIAKTVIKQFYSFYSSHFEDIITKQLSDILDLGDTKAFKAFAKQRKTPDIPDFYFNNLLIAIIKIIDDDKAPTYIRAIACLYLILSQTGLRIGEILSLEVGCLKPTTIFDNEQAYYLEYQTWKRVSGNNVYVTVNTYTNELTQKGYSCLLKLHKYKRSKLKMNYLYMGGRYIRENPQIPLDSNTFIKLQKKFYTYIDRYIPTINLEINLYPELTKHVITELDDIRSIAPHIITLTYPTNHQYRVHVCTMLYKNGVSLKYIQKYMAHLTNEMQGYYVRPSKKSPQEDMEFTLSTLEKIVTGETKLLGDSKGVFEGIQEFIKENHYNVATDLKDICETLATKIPIRQKTGGVCIQSSMLRECSKDAKTNEFYCAYGVCPNIFHFYYMADVSYRQTKELTETITINKERGHLRQAQKELNMLLTIINSKLLPELDELNIIVLNKGIQSIIEEYPDLLYIIENTDKIYQEIDIWKKMKL